MTRRIETLDWLRGLMALSIMFFHLGAFGYLGGPYDAGTVLGRLGIYGVSIFFILSGLSMAIAYDKYISNARTSINFFIRRIFRICPLLTIAVIAVAIPAYFSGSGFSVALIIANMTATFGFIMPSAYINMGAWSIGNEMVYYAMTPAFILLYRRNIVFGNAVTVVAAAVGVVFSFLILQHSIPLSGQWKLYINPFNNLFLYCAGVALFYNFKSTAIHIWPLTLLLVVAVGMFALYPVTGDQVNIVTGFNRIAMSIIAVAIVFCFYKMPLSLPTMVSAPLERIGIATYGVYLLHPLIIKWLEPIFIAQSIQNDYVFAATVAIATVVVSLLTFKYVETPMIAAGKRITKTRFLRSRLAEAAI